MRKFNKVLIVMLTVVSLFGFTKPTSVHAATAPNLGIAESYSIWGKAGVANTGAPTHIWGNVGADLLSNITGLISSQVDGTMAGPVPGLQTAITAAYGELNAQGADGGQTLSGTVTITPGVWTVGAATLNGTVTLDGAGVYIFRSSSNITVDPGAQVVLGPGVSACDVFWQVPDAMTIGVGAHIEGTIITDTSLISIGTNATLKGRAFSSVAQVTLDNNQVTNPCLTQTSSGGPNTGTINVVKTVVNDGNGVKTISNFPLFVNGQSVISGITNIFSAPGPIYTVTETTDPNYTRTFSGDCDVNGQLNLTPGDNKFCIVTNNDIGASAVVPPLIDVVKVPTPLALPAGPGPVTYTYTLSNIGTIPVSNITMVGDTCSPVVLVSGDTNANSILEVNETWIHSCSTTLPATHTNTIVATGWGNNISAVDIASSTVVVGVPIVPPLIHVTKIPSPLSLGVGGGMVTYTKRVTNPGTVALSNVRVSDDKCGPVQYISGDINSNSMLDTTETWIYTCQTNLNSTTTNTATASGDANGLTARDFAIATVVVAVPKLPKTGFPPEENALWSIVIPAGVLIVLSSLYIARKKQII